MFRLTSRLLLVQLFYRCFYYYYYHLRYHYRCHHCHHHHLMLCSIGLYMYCRRRSRNDCFTIIIVLLQCTCRFAFIGGIECDEMLTIVTDVCGVCLSVSLSVCRGRRVQCTPRAVYEGSFGTAVAKCIWPLVSQSCLLQRYSCDLQNNLRFFLKPGAYVGYP